MKCHWCLFHFFFLLVHHNSWIWCHLAEWRYELLSVVLWRLFLGWGKEEWWTKGVWLIWLKWRSRVSACQLCRWGSPKGITELLYRGIIGDWAWLDNNGFESSQQSGCFKYGSGENILKEILFDYSFPWPFKFSQQSLTASATPACSWLINVIWFGAHQIRARESYICSKQNYGWIKPLTCDEK